MALLIHTSIQFSPITLDFSDSIEVIGAAIASQVFGCINVFSVYVPNGNGRAEELRTLFNGLKEFVVAGDFNAHHHHWESTCVPNRCGHLLANILESTQETHLVTPKDFRTRINPSTGSNSTIDLCLLSTRLAIGASITLGPYMGSDHLPVKFSLFASPSRSTSRSPAWIFDKDKWGTLNTVLARMLQEKEFLKSADPIQAFHLFTNGIKTSSLKTFRMRNPNPKQQYEPGRPWWNEACVRAVALSRKPSERGGIHHFPLRSV